jgi:hypothetical protein
MRPKLVLEIRITDFVSFSRMRESILLTRPVDGGCVVDALILPRAGRYFSSLVPICEAEPSKYRSATFGLNLESRRMGLSGIS